MRVPRPRRPRRFRPADSAQQIVGGFLLAGPFVVTEEVWQLAGNMGALQAIATVTIVFIIGYATLFKADTGRDRADEPDIGGIPVRFISLMCVAFGSVSILVFLLDAPGTFIGSEVPFEEAAQTTFNVVSVGAVFSVVGAATADSIF